MTQKTFPSATRFDQVEQALDQARPFLAMHGGGIQLIDVTDEGVVKVALRGHCVGCSLSTMTMKLGIERLLCDNLPDIVSSVQEV